MKQLRIAASGIVAICLLVVSGHNFKQCTSRIYCSGPLLEMVQKSGLFADSKTFVDMPTRFSEERVLAEFARLGDNPRLKAVRSFVSDHFLPVGTELEIVEPPDWRPSPQALQRIRSGELKKFAEMLHGKWRHLMRKSDASKKCGECVMSSLSLRHPFIIPGGRFREFYYWDSFWILEGVIVSGMCETAGNTIENMLGLVEEFGFVPNGSRVYYLTRSQPPLLIDMVERYMESCLGSFEERQQYIARIMDTLVGEYEFWMEHRSVQIGAGHKLNIYKADQREPRPESFREDTGIANMLDAKGDCYQDIASAAESGWDFSGRWFEDGQTMSLIRTSKIVPVDLNSVLFNNELKLAQFSRVYIKDGEKADVYEEAAKKRQKSMKELMWDGKMWSDYDTEARTKRQLKDSISNKSHIYISSLMPLIFHVSDDGDTTSFDSLLNKYPGGVVTSEANTGQQWDFPNVWAPIQYRLIRWWLERKERGKALELAQRFVTSSYCGHQKYGYIFEKYHGERVGEPGGGGEYVVQEGFGWTNGVLLWIFSQFPEELTAPITCTRYESSLLMDSPHVRTDRIIITLLFIGVIVIGLVLIISRLVARGKN